NVHEIAIGAGQQSGRHFDDGDCSAESGIYGSELETDIAATNDEQRLWNLRKVERGGRVHDPRIVDLEHRRDRRERTGGENGVLESQCVRRTVGFLQPQCVRIGDLSETLNVIDLTVLDELPRAAREPLDDVVLEFAQLRQIDLRLAKLDAPCL